MQMKKREFVEQFPLKPESILQTYTKAESQEWVERWRGVYAAGERAPGLAQYLWHTFSWDAYPSVSGEDADRLYSEHRDSKVIVLPNDRKTAFRVASPPVSDRVIDFYVFPPDLAWTMAFTHEDGWLGPYFAKHPDYEAMVEKAKQQRLVADRKAKELERAKQNGWI